MQAVFQNSSPVINFEQLVIAQRDDPDLSKLWSTTNSLDLRDIYVPVSGNLLTCDTSTGTQRPVVPVQLQRSIFKHLHLLSHLSIQPTQSLIMTRYVWPGINKAVRQWAKICIKCQHSEIHWYVVTPLSTFTTPDTQFDMVYIDTVGPLPSSKDLNIYSPVLISSGSGLKPFRL